MYENVVTFANLLIWFEWDEKKAASNLAKHSVSFETALRVFGDPLAHAEIERIENGEVRWQTVGQVDGRLLLLVVHTSNTIEGSERIEAVRIISARRPTRRERLLYEKQDG